MNEKNFFGSNKFEKIINRGSWNKERGEGSAKKIKKLISGGTSIGNLRVEVTGRKRCEL